MQENLTGNVAPRIAGLKSFGKRHHVVDRCGRASDINPYPTNVENRVSS